MRPFDTLIELSENELDAKRKELASLEEDLATALARRAAIDEELAREQQVVSSDTDMGFAYASFANHLIHRREQADTAVAAATEAVEVAREVVREAFAELRRYELAHEARLEQERKKQAAKDQIELDEIAGNLLRRQNDRL